MKLKFLILFFGIIIFNKSFAAHLKGGWIRYEYVSTDNVARTNTYIVTVRQYMLISASGGQLDQQVFMGVFDLDNNSKIRTVTIDRTGTFDLIKQTFDPCIDPVPPLGVKYKILDFSTTITLPFNSNGYTLSVQRCCRIPDRIVNVPNSGEVGITYVNTIPSKINNIDFSANSSPEFGNLDTAIICKSSPFEISFEATDKENDSLVYIFCNGLNGASRNDPNPSTSANPPYQSIPYTGGYSGNSPLGNQATINSKTGLVSGIAPNISDEYVLSVCVLEYRNGIQIGSSRKEIHVTVNDCALTAAELKPSYINCDSLVFYFKNETTAQNIISYLWSFGDGNTDTVETPRHIYKDTGVYDLKLEVTANSASCISKATAKVKAFPGFSPGFRHIGYCFQTPFRFTDTTYAAYGFVDSLHWDFGDLSTTNDVSKQKNPSYKYPNGGNRTVTQYARSSKGCEKEITRLITITDKPFIKLNFKDTLICTIDSVPLIAQSTPNATFSWTPRKAILNPSSSTAIVFPKDTTVYVVTVTDSGCINKDTLTVNTLPFIKVDAGPDADICLKDSYKMKTKSFALGYVWTPALTLDNPKIKFPEATPTAKKTTYYVTANLGYCQDKDSVTINTNPYPISIVNPDTTICFGDTVQLNGTIGNGIIPNADTFYWSPRVQLKNFNTLTPTAKPNFTQRYILTSQFKTGCLKPIRDTLNVNIIQPFGVFAGNDSNVVLGQPVQLNAWVLDTSNKFFTWRDITFGNPGNIFSTIRNPIVNLNSNQDSVIYQVRAYTKENCEAFDKIKLRIFKTKPSVFVPNAFTPNNDAARLNEIFRPICAGISTLNFFNVYNRWGQLLYTTTTVGAGWDGKFNGEKQPPGAYVYTLKAVDYLGNVITDKGTFVLIR